MTVPQKIQNALRLYNMIPDDHRLIVGVSGGADSLALLHVLVGLRERLGLELHAVTVEHGMRGDASVADAEFVVRMCNEWQVPVSMVPVRAKLRAGSGVEAALRSLRYRVFAKVADELGASTVAVAHQADDQAETVLMHIIRGGGLRGLAGMGWRNPLPGQPNLTLIRPMLDVTRAEIDAYCAEHGLSPRVDATNSDTSYLRNRLRHDVLPQLRTINPQIDRALLHLADVASVEDTYVEQQLAAVTAGVRAEDGYLRFSRRTFAELHPALQRRFVVWAASKIGPTDDLAYEHVVAAVDLALRGETGARALLPGGAQLRIDYQHLIFERQDAPPMTPDMPLLEAGQIVPLVVGINPVNERWMLEVTMTPDGDDFTHVLIAGERWQLRTRREGDMFAPAHLKGRSRSVKRWMVDRKMPAALRDQLPLFVVGETIAAIAYDNQWIITTALESGADATDLYVRWVRPPE